jgi:sulfur oxidation c-type cytochrome SoxX
MRTALAIASLIVLGVHGAVFYQQFFHKWEQYQTAYFDQARTRSRSEAERAELSEREPKIEQTLVTLFGDTRVDRCATCHVAADDPRFKDQFQPLRTHPYSAALGDVEREGRWERRHKFTEFGCTICHDGQGRGLEEVYAHGKDAYWPEPLLGYVWQENWRKDFRTKLAGKEYMEANCAQCHTGENFAGTPHVERGRQLFFKTNCYGCHKIQGLSDGTLGPELTEAGRKFKVDYLWESIAEPRANLASSFMPQFKLSEGDIKSLVIFLKSRRGMNFNETTLDRFRARLAPAKLEGPGAAARAGDPVARGRESLKERACTACHKLGAEDGGIAPDLSFEGLLKDQDWIFGHFRNPRSAVPDSIMPTFHFGDDEFGALAAYLGSLTTKPAAAGAAETYNAYCQRCHGGKGDGKGPIAYYIDPAPRDLTKASFFESKPRERFLESIRKGVPGTSMPAWGKAFSEAQIEAVYGYVEATFTKPRPRALKARNVPGSNPVEPSPDSIRRGEEIYLARCTGCHGRKADGKGPNSLDILPHPRNLRNSWFVNAAGDQRMLESILYGVQGTAMPPWIDYGLSRKDAGDLLNYIRSLNPAPVRGRQMAGVR